MSETTEQTTLDEAQALRDKAGNPIQLGSWVIAGDTGTAGPVECVTHDGACYRIAAAADTSDVGKVEFDLAENLIVLTSDRLPESTPAAPLDRWRWRDPALHAEAPAGARQRYALACDCLLALATFSELIHLLIDAEPERTADQVLDNQVMAAIGELEERMGTAVKHHADQAAQCRVADEAEAA